MKIEEVQKLTDEELGLKVAVLCGWHKGRSEKGWNITNPNRDFRTVRIHEWWEDKNGRSGGGQLQPPDYVHDLNDMHEAEMSLKSRRDGRWLKFATTLGDMSDSLPEQVSAEARKRAEAFVVAMAG